MISAKVLGAYACVGAEPPDTQASWYRKAAQEWQIDAFEVPFFADRALAAELADALAETASDLVVTLVAQWAGAGQKNTAYGLSSPDDRSRHAALVDTFTILHQCAALSERGIGIRDVLVHTGQRVGETIPHAVALYRSLLELGPAVAALLPDCTLSVEVADSLPPDHPSPFPHAKKASLPLGELIDAVATANRDLGADSPVALMVNWGRLLINRTPPLEGIQRILDSEVPLSGVILSGAGPSPHGFTDSHNSHLDPESGFTEADGMACAAALKTSPDPIFLGMKCSRNREGDLFSIEEVLTAEADLLAKAV
jgi:hypothetical protein